MPYCTRADIEAIYGAFNVRKWADLDNRNSQTEIAARINYACAWATAKIDAWLRGGVYAIPFVEPLDPLIVDMTAKLAAYHLYMGRPADSDEAEEDNNRIRAVAKAVEKDAREIRAGRLRLGVESKAKLHPQSID